MKIVKFEDKYRQAFIDLNTEWITKLFGKIEPDDVETFEHIDELIAEGAIDILRRRGRKGARSVHGEAHGRRRMGDVQDGRGGPVHGNGRGVRRLCEMQGLRDRARGETALPRFERQARPRAAHFQESRFPANARWDTANTSAATSHTNISSKTTNKCAPPSAIHDGARIRFFVSKDRPPDYSSGGYALRS